MQGLVGMRARKAVADAIKNGDTKVAVDYLKRKHRDEFSERIEQHLDAKVNAADSLILALGRYRQKKEKEVSNDPHDKIDI